VGVAVSTGVATTWMTVTRFPLPLGSGVGVAGCSFAKATGGPGTVAKTF